MYTYSQLVVPRWVLLSGVGWHTFGASGTIARIRQLPGVNDDSIIFSDNGETTSNRPFIGPFGITDLAIVATPGASAGHGISFRVPDGRSGLAQDMTTLERLVLRGFPGSGIYVRGGSPLRLDYITTLWNGRFGIEVEDTHVDTDNGSVHQLSMKHISGDGNMGGVADGGGSTVSLKGLMAHKAAVSLLDIKSEYRVRPIGDSGDGSAMGNYHAVVIEDCACPIAATGVEHIATGSQTRKPGNAIQVKGPKRPDLLWQSVTVRDDHPSQTVGGAPYRVFDEVLSRGSSAPHGVLGVSIESYTPDQIATQVDTSRRDDLAIGESTLSRRVVTDAGVALTPGTLYLTYFTAMKSEAITLVRTCSGSVTAAEATLCRIAVYEVDDKDDLTLVGATENDPSLWSAADTAYGLAFAESFTKRRGVRYAVGLLVAGASVGPTILGQSHILQDEAAQKPRLSGALPGSTDLPADIMAESVAPTSVQVYAALTP
uniref:Uncharacterized protein n=1 Tax=Mycolicibacterium gilvum (strain PYR-GCK) TaxID=350054 RepID=A4TF50_MYCGI|nr:hypothetical protein Mflv_4756 [Mycolicibacterium gilvum PYR-GCK]